jgi:filamentous hemagglutinin family protein
MKNIFYAFSALGLTALLFPTQIAAQTIAPAADGTNTQVSRTGDRIDISGGTTGGSNLFHSFQQFGVAPGQTANFLSNPSIQNILGRVTGGDPSVIQGLIQVSGGNSNLYLMNPAGIVFGAGASLNVPAAFTATTADRIGFSNQWFNASGTNNYANLGGTPNSFAFTSTQPGSIVNSGNLAVAQGQTLTLLGGTVINTGTLSAPGGQVTVAAVPGGQQVNIQYSPLLTLTTRPIPTTTNTALSLPELLTGGNLEQATKIQVNPDGTVQLMGTGAKITPAPGLAIASGTLNAASTTGTGGKVHVLGNQVGLVKSTIDASGATGGGTVLVGGDYQGNGTVPNAQRTYISPDSTIRVDALTAGNGGKAIMWADGTTQFYGSISARGGSQSGNGGLVEVSGKEGLQFRGTVDTSAAKGQPGTLLLDPQDIIIANGASSPGVDAGLADGTILAGDFGSNSLISISTATLSSLSGNVTLQASRDITVLNDLTFTPGTAAQTVTFTAGRNFDLFGTLNTQGRSLILNAGNATPTGEVTIRSFSNGISTNGGNVTINAPLVSNPTMGTINAGSGQIQLNQPLTFGDSVNLTGSTVQVGQVTVLQDLTINGATRLAGGTVRSNFGNIALNGPVTLAGNATVENRSFSNGSLAINGTIDGNHTLTLRGGRGGMTLGGNIGSITPLASFTAASESSPTQIGGNITTNGGNIRLGDFGGSIILTNDSTLTSAGGSILVRDRVNSDATPRSLTLAAGTGNATLESPVGAINPLSALSVSGNTIQVNDIRTTGNLTLDAQQNLAIANSTLAAGGDINLLAGNTVQLQDGANPGQELIVNAGNNLLVRGNQAITIQAANNPLSRLQAGGTITLVSDGLITANARFLAGGSLSFLTLSSAPGTVKNDTQTLISSAGDVTFGNYEGLSLKVESLGSITGGTIDITGPNATLSGTDPDIPLLVGSPALILQAGLPSLQNPVNTPQNSGGTSFAAAGITTSPATITVGTIQVAADASPGDARIDGVVLSAPGTIQTGNISTQGKSVTVSSGGGNIVAGDIGTGGLDTAGNSLVRLSANAGNITVNTIDAGGGGVDVTAAGTFQAIGSKFFNGGTFQNQELILGENPALIEFLVNTIPGLTRESLAGSTTRINVDTVDLPVSIITRPNNISDPNNAQIVIRHGGESVPGSRIRVEGSGGNIQFVTGPKVTPIATGFAPLFGNVSDFDPTLPTQTFTLQRAELYQTLTVPGDLPANASGSVGSILVGAGSNSNLYSIVRDRPFDPSRPVTPINPGTPSDPSNPGTPRTPSSPAPSSPVSGAEGQDVERSQQRQLAVCPPQNLVASAGNPRDRSSTSTGQPCTSPADEAQILKILNEPSRSESPPKLGEGRGQKAEGRRESQSSMGATDPNKLSGEGGGQEAEGRRESQSSFNVAPPEIMPMERSPISSTSNP